MLCLGLTAVLVAVNLYYLHGLYMEIKGQRMNTVRECVRRADMLEIIDRIMTGENASADEKDDDSFLKLTVIVEGEPSPSGGYSYARLSRGMQEIMSDYFHVIGNSDNAFRERDYPVLDSIFNEELHHAGLHPERAFIVPPDSVVNDTGLWRCDFSLHHGEGTVCRAYFSSLSGDVLRQMAGITATSGGILAAVSFLIWYLIHTVMKLRTIEEMKDDFTHNMTHELKTPVAVAFSAADSMLRYYDQSDDARNKKFLRIIMQRLTYLSGMIENILSMSMERFREMNLRLERVEVRPLLEEVSELMELKAGKPVEVVLDVEPEGLVIEADPLHFGNMVSNLLDNAVKYSGASVRIHVKASRGGISVADNGVGIPASSLPYIFDKFYRVSTGDRHEAGGYGLGLFYVARIAELSGWSVSVESTRGKGSCFTIDFSGKRPV